MSSQSEDDGIRALTSLRNTFQIYSMWVSRVGKSYRAWGLTRTHLGLERESISAETFVQFRFSIIFCYILYWFYYTITCYFSLLILLEPSAVALPTGDRIRFVRTLEKQRSWWVTIKLVEWREDGKGKLVFYYRFCLTIKHNKCRFVTTFLAVFHLFVYICNLASLFLSLSKIIIV